MYFSYKKISAPDDNTMSIVSFKSVHLSFSLTYKFLEQFSTTLKFFLKSYLLFFYYFLDLYHNYVYINIM